MKIIFHFCLLTSFSIYFSTAKTLGQQKASKLRKMAYNTKFGIVDFTREQYE